MRDLFNQDRALSPGTVRFGLRLFSGFVIAMAILVILVALRTLLSGAVIAAMAQFIGGTIVLLGLSLLVRLAAEALFALQRLNDRLTVLSDDLRYRPTDEGAAPVNAGAGLNASAQGEDVPA